jgi:5-formyltetrahydrofolate cyclo-ligase
LRLETIHPQPHDIPMRFIVTERGVMSVADNQPVAAR